MSVNAVRVVATIVGAVIVIITTSSCAFEACCMRPATGLYDICFSAAVPPPSGDAATTTGPRSLEIAPPTAPEAPLRRAPAPIAQR